MKVLFFVTKEGTPDNVWDGTKVSGMDNTAASFTPSQDSILEFSTDLLPKGATSLAFTKDTAGNPSYTEEFTPVATISGDGSTMSIYFSASNLSTLGESFSITSGGTPIGTVSVSNGVLVFTAGCLAAGTKITMSDGTTKNIEDIKKGDLIRTFDHELGQLSTSDVCLSWKSGISSLPLILTFSSGTELSIITTHGLLLEDTRKYVQVNNSNVEKYLGKTFYNAELNTWDRLVSYRVGEEPVSYYSIYSANQLNCVANGILTIPDDVDYLLNIYELDESLKADENRLAEEIEQFGLFEIDDYPEYKELMKKLKSEYVKIAVGKGLTTMKFINSLRLFWEQQISYENN